MSEAVRKARERARKKNAASGHLRKMFDLLWPGTFGKVPTIDFSQPGSGYLCSLIGFALFRSTLYAYNIQLTKRIVSGIHMRDSKSFFAALQTQAFMGVGFALQRNIIAYCANNLALVFRQKLTKILHTNYFSAMNYYFIANAKDTDVTDPDERITEDVKKITGGIATIVTQVCYAASSSVYFTLLHFRTAFFDNTLGLSLLGKIGYAICPIVYMFFALKLQKAIAGISSTEFGLLKGKLGKVFGEYRTSVVRTQLHAGTLFACFFLDSLLLCSRIDLLVSFSCLFACSLLLFTFVCSRIDLLFF